MKTTVRRWGNSLAVRIPKTISKELSIDESTEVEILAEDGRMILEPHKRYRLKDMLSEITNENLHGEIDTGTRTGVEEW
ncbi:MAG: AbrB/MazE/SpoVT family DNA-binding domain-containing protein [Candidatus Fermentibacteraceae bacterium]|nr:AbrB/MazE/SpoVT family DNA-binding domain-containing protein [Candidatus Fermentibacteraceae bacterium]MBN2859661.1 AbrB/MazE/SpoVT family DNA-binding domain-containing protein [Sphaerochaetaceae bacterium]